MFRTALLSALVAWIAAPSLAHAQTDKYERARREASRFQLFGGADVVLDVNQFQCGLRNVGDTCSNVFDSPTGGGGFWPTGSPNQYMFNAGLNMAGIIPSDAGFPWAGDTVAAYFFDATGFQKHGDALTNFSNSLDPADLAAWPGLGSVRNFPELTGFVVDEELFNPVLLDKANASQQDTWVAYWDGNPVKLANRSHPMGILVEQRTMAWNFPEGNEATIYFVYKFKNVTDNPEFQRLNEGQFFGGQDVLPDAGWRIDSIYVAFDADPDVTNDFDKNYSTGILPFDLGISYEGEFLADDFDYPPELFHAPFFTNAPGIVGIKYLKSPVDPGTGEELGLTLFTIHENSSQPGAVFFDPEGEAQLWRYLSGNINPGAGDPPCTFANPKERRLCFQSQQPTDTRFLQASGPFSLDAGESQTVVVAMFAAATVETPLITLGNTEANPPGIPSLRTGCEDPIRPIEVGAGWISTQPLACTETTGKIDQFKVDVVPGSLLGKALVAQTIFDNKFLLGFAPDAPQFVLVPGDNQVTVVWEASPTEENGDPFFAAASDPANALFNPNYREFDVEGYRIYRGTSPSNLRLIAQFDKSDTKFVDSTCETDATFVFGDVCDATVEVDIVSPFVQFAPGNVVRLEDGTPLVTAGDTAMAAGIEAGNARALTNTGVTFVFEDNTARNGFQYFYKVTAFDLNSLKSGPTSLEGAGTTKSVFPQVPATDLDLAGVDFDVAVLDRDGIPQPDPETVRPTLDPATGTFSGPAPPTDGFGVANFAAFAPTLLVPGEYTITLDSVIPVYYSGEYYFTISGVGTAVVGSPEASGLGPVFIDGDAPPGSHVEFVLPPLLIPSDPEKLTAQRRAGVDAPVNSGSLFGGLTMEFVVWHSADADWSYTVPNFWPEGDSPPDPDALDGGTRWFSGDNETMADPTLGLAHGELDGVTTIFQPVPFQDVLGDPALACNSGAGPDHMRRFFQSTWLARRAADIKVYWGSAGVDSVIDVTHNYPVPYSTHIRASYGFLTDADGNGTLDYKDFWFSPGLELTSTIGCASQTNPTNLAQQPVVMDTDVDGDRVGDGQGFGMYIAGEPFLFQTSMPSNTVWTYRSHSGVVSRDGSGNYELDETGRMPGVPGLTLQVTVNSAAELVPDLVDLKEVHTVPDPYYAVSQFDLGPNTKRMRFVNLPSRATIRIYTVGGVLVDVINHDDPSGGGQATWDLRNRSDQFVASGVYFFHVSTPEGKSHIGKFTIINFAN